MTKTAVILRGLKMKEEYFLVNRDIKGKEDSASEAISLGWVPLELLEALDADIKEYNANNDTGEIILYKKQNLSYCEKKKLDNLTLSHIWKRCLEKSNPILLILRKHYMKYDISPAESKLWEIMIGQPYPQVHFALRTADKIQEAKGIIASIPKCSDTGDCNEEALIEYALRLIWLYESWLSPDDMRWSLTKGEMFSYFRRCLAWMGNDYSDEIIKGLLKKLDKNQLIQLQPEQDSGLEEPYYELTTEARLQAAGSISRDSVLTSSDVPMKTIPVNTEPSTDALFLADKMDELKEHFSEKMEHDGTAHKQRTSEKDSINFVKDGKWVSQDDFCAIMNFKPRTPATYRYRGRKEKDGLSGIDSQNNHWRKHGTKQNEKPKYFVLHEKLNSVESEKVKKAEKQQHH